MLDSLILFIDFILANKIIFVSAPVILFVLQAVGIFYMSKRLEIKNSYFAFIPFLSEFAFGRISEKYIKRNGKKSAKFSFLLCVSAVIEAVIGIIFFVVSKLAIEDILANAQNAIENDAEMTIEMFSAVVPVVAVFLIWATVVLLYKTIYFVALWRLLKIYNPKNATLLTVFSVIFAFLPEIFIFINRKNQPVFDETAVPETPEYQVI